MHAHSRLDRWPARVGALVLAVLILILMAWIGRNDLPGFALGNVNLGLAGGVEGVTAPRDANPELAACLEQRLTVVDKMRSDGIVSDAQYETFRNRAIAFCEAEHPPGG
ncbi:hypothetical protein HPQ64_12245 [Rhizobiales bacterium]|uniref:hypothetical protein n=1 Tax=Hongsoonwoonella zoysiae TaxID=2821844 RepID=UPI001560E980|nr:hypothetical protein [Hongsoonwoonella zoysiae]NRG18461.1 hypothetical protein [Hongsoonwoonella zoysiae]